MTSDKPDSFEYSSVSDAVRAQPAQTSFVWTPQAIVLSVLLFIAAGLLEVGGGWLVWQSVREGKTWIYAALGVMALVGYGFVPCLQPTSDFGRIYAIYGGFFIVLAFAWSKKFDGYMPDLGDFVGSGIALFGVLVIMLWPR